MGPTMQPAYAQLPGQAQSPLEQGMKKLASTGTVLAIVQLCLAVMGLANAATGAATGMNSLQGSGLDTVAFERALEAYMEKALLYEAIRTIPFIAMSAWLLVICSKLKKLDAASLKTARTWCLAAFGVLTFSVILQAVFVIPEVNKLVDAMGDMVAGHSREATQARSMIATFVQIGTVGGLIIGTAAMAIWPIYLLRRAGKLIEMVQTS